MWRRISDCDREPHQAIDIIFDLLQNLLEVVPIGLVVCEIIAQEPVVLLCLVFGLLTVASENEFGCRASDILQYIRICIFANLLADVYTRHPTMLRRDLL